MGLLVEKSEELYRTHKRKHKLTLTEKKGVIIFVKNVMHIIQQVKS